MRCPRCDASLADNARQCKFCGQDLTIVHYVGRISNSYYNMGLEKAQVRDLSGAIEILKKSLQYNKRNIEARNLLGLIYYEMGETVAALSEWVLSKYLQPEENRADYFMETVQKNQTQLDATNQTIKKYNSALSAAQAGNDDLAVIQLKKVVSLNPRFVRAQQLLALLYINSKEYGKAAKCLGRARKVDYNNTTTMRYMQEISEYTANIEKKNQAQEKKVPKKDPLENVMPVGNYKEEKRSLMPAIYVIIGVIVGIAVCFLLIRPTLLKNGTDSSQLTDANEQLSVQASKISSLEKEKESLEEEINDLKAQIEKADSEALEQVASYEKLLEGVDYYMKNDKVNAAVAVADCKKTDFKSKTAKNLYTAVGNIPEEEIQALVEQGKNEMYSSYSQAAATFKNVLEVDEDNQEAMLYLGRCFQRQDKKKLARKWYKEAIDVNDTTEFATQAEAWRAEMDGKTEEPGQDAEQ